MPLNADYFPGPGEHLANDPVVARWTMIGLAIAAVISVVLIVATVLV